MSLFTTLAASIWRDYIVDGNAGSGLYNVLKSEVRAWGTIVETNLDAHDTSITGLLTYEYPSLTVADTLNPEIVLKATTASARDYRIRDDGGVLSFQTATDHTTWTTFWTWTYGTGFSFKSNAGAQVAAISDAGDFTAVTGTFSGQVNGESVGGNWVASQAEAEAGTDDTQIMTPLKVAQAVDVKIPAGTLFDYAGTTVPTGFLDCDGSAVSRTTYADLFAAIGTTWGVGDGSTTFNLPNLTDRFTRADGAGSVGDLVAGSVESHTHGPGTLKTDTDTHNHSDSRVGSGSGIAQSASSLGITSGSTDNDSHSHNITSGTTDAYGGTETAPIHAVVKKMIKT